MVSSDALDERLKEQMRTLELSSQEGKKTFSISVVQRAGLFNDGLRNDNITCKNASQTSEHSSLRCTNTILKHDAGKAAMTA